MKTRQPQEQIQKQTDKFQALRHVSIKTGLEWGWCVEGFIARCLRYNKKEAETMPTQRT